MNAVRVLQAWLAAARRRRIAIVAAFAAPWLAVALGLAWRQSELLMRLLPIAVLAVAVDVARRGAMAMDDAWLARRLDAGRRDLEDSAALLFADPARLGALARLQRERLQQRLASAPTPELRPRWPLRALGFNVLAALALVLGLFAWQSRLAANQASHAAVATSAAPDTAKTGVVSQSISIAPPAYTGLPARRQAGGQVRVVEGSTLTWTLRIAPSADGATLVFHDGVRLPLQRQGEDWIGHRQLSRSTLYRIELAGDEASKASPLQRIEVIADRAPQLRVIEPDRNLTVLEARQASWPLRFEASDDYGLGAATLRITLAQGSGENISVSAREIGLVGQGDARRRRYSRQLDLASLGFAVGDDLVVRVSVSDRRAPNPQTTRSASFILRWPPEVGAQATGIDGLVKRTLPAYFRSQRQIIIDSEALIANRRKQSGEEFLRHADEIGVDQRILRLRYGQFLGEEAEGGRRAGPPPSKASDAPAPVDAHADEHAGEAKPADANAAADGSALVEQFGHTHDEAEAATLLDPDTRTLLRAALNEMWQAELHLRQGRPELALPYEYRALRLVKQVQQSSRIYLARVGLELPPIDPTRRLGGDRAGLASRRDGLVPAQAPPTPVRDLWQALDGERPGATAAELDAFERWLRAQESQLPAALDLYASVDALRRAPDCRDCALALRARLWPLLEKSVPVVRARSEPDRIGRAYLDALPGGPAQ